MFIAFETAHPGHGDGAVDVLLEAIILHEVEIDVTMEGHIAFAVRDGQW